MAEQLKGPAVGPDGDRFKAGQDVPAHWPDWYVADLRSSGHIGAPEPDDGAERIRPKAAKKVAAGKHVAKPQQRKSTR